jgi:hypothetical protein
MTTHRNRLVLENIPKWDLRIYFDSFSEKLEGKKTVVFRWFFLSSAPSKDLNWSEDRFCTNEQLQKGGQSGNNPNDDFNVLEAI